MANDVSARYTQREKRERRKDRYLGTAVGGSAVGLGVLDRNTRPGSLSAMRGASRNASLVINGKAYPSTARALAAVRSLRGPRLRHLAAAGLLAGLAGAGRRGLRERDPKQFMAKADTWKELKSQTVYGMPSHQTARLGARGRSEAMARSIPDPALPFVAPKGERGKAAQAQAKATASGAALGTAAGAAAGALIGGPKAWKASGKHAGKALRQLKGLANAKARPAQPTLPGMGPSRTDRLATLKRKAGQRFTAQRRADLARGAVGGAVTGTAVNINSANAAKETVAANPKAWERNDRKIQRFVNKRDGEVMPTLAEIAKAQRRYAEKKSTRDAATLTGVGTSLGGAAAIDYGIGARQASRSNRELSRSNAKIRNRNMNMARLNLVAANQDMGRAVDTYGRGSFSSAKAEGMRQAIAARDRRMTGARRQFAAGRRAGRAAAQQRLVAGKQARRGKLALIGGGTAIAGGVGLAAYGNRKKVSKAIEPDVDPTGFLDYVRREHEPLRDSAGRFAGKAVDDVGPAIVATPYPEEE